MTRASLLLVSLACIVAAGPVWADIPLTAAESKCVAKLNKRGAKVAGAQGKQNRFCVRMAGKGKIAAETACLDGDAKGKIETARAKTVADFAKHCTDVPDVGPDDAGAVNDAFEDEARNLARDLFGDLAFAVASKREDPAHAKCQDKITKDAGKIFEAALKVFNGCTKDSAKAGIAAAADLARCLTPLGIAADAKGKIAGKVTKLGEDIASACASVTAPLPLGECGGLTGDALRDCVDAQVACRVCLALAAADDLVVDCTAAAGIVCPPAAAACGDGVRQGPEACDLGDDANCPGQCDGTCQCPAAPAVCGDGVVGAGEECDGADAASCPGECQPDCSCPTPQTCDPPKGLTTAGAQFLHQDSAGVQDVAEPSDLFGNALRAGDFDGDGFDDLAVAVTSERADATSATGAIAVLYGAASGLHGTAHNQLWTALSIGLGDFDQLFGAVAIGDFNGDGRDDLIARGNDFLDCPGTCVIVPFLLEIYGSPAGLSAHSRRLMSIGAATAGEFTGDAYDDLIVTSAFEDGEAQAGHRRLLVPGSASGLDWSAAVRHYDAGYAGVFVMISADFDADPIDDIVEGYPEALAESGSIRIVLNPFTPAEAAESWSQDSPGMVGASESLDRFGATLAAGDFNGDGHTDLLVGVPGEDAAFADQGSFHRIFGDGSGLTATGNQLFGATAAQAGAGYATAMAAGNFDASDTADEIAVGAPSHDVLGVPGSGMVDVRFTSATTTVWHQAVPGIAGDVESGDSFGNALAAGDFNGDGTDDLAIGVRNESIGAAAAAGAINVLYGAPCP